MRETRANDMPSAECPHCGAAFQWDDYYELEVGDERECPKCEKPIYVTEVDFIIHATLSDSPPAAAGGKTNQPTPAAAGASKSA